MANESNLKPITELSSEEAKKRGHNGGIASVKARREKKLFKEEIERQLKNTLEDIIKSTIEQAKKGNITATEFLRNTIGEKPTDKVENINTEIAYEDYIKKVENEDEY